ncbi:MAG: response regulator transcription factor [Anaerolineae bacterium]|nr:response regulator transcription factor [Anaerolineae bacterium]
MSDRIRLLVVEDHIYLREQLCILLADFEYIVVVGSTDNGQAAIDLCASLHPHVVLIDATIPVLDGFAATEWIRQHFPDVRVVMLTNGREGEDERAARAGASAVLLKPVESERIISAIRKVSANL